MEMKPFTDEDWLGFAGAEPSDDGRQPMIGHFEEQTVIVDKSGLTLFRTKPEPMYKPDDYSGSTYHRVFLPFDVALVLAAALTPEALRMFDADSDEC